MTELRQERAPMRNRVGPMGDLIATELRGAWTGNRGILHRGTEVVRFHASDLWITCVLQFKDWRLPQWAPHHFTVLFFHDEAVSLAAGHRPCALCRRADYNAYRQAWAAATGGAIPLAKDMDRCLHGERIVRGTHRRRLHPMNWAELPDATFVLVDGGTAAVVVGDRVVPWTPTGYGRPANRPTIGMAEVITPPPTVAALHAGYCPQLDPTLGAPDPSATARRDGPGAGDVVALAGRDGGAA